jgi:DNA invertase Pin-like site-specific DNA recombinase
MGSHPSGGRDEIRLNGIFSDQRSGWAVMDQQHIDTTTPTGRLLFQITGAFAEFERSMIRSRVNAGLARARAQGKRLGRRPISDAVLAKIREKLTTGAGILTTAKDLGVGTGTVHRVKREMAAVAA